MAVLGLLVLRPTAPLVVLLLFRVLLVMRAVTRQLRRGRVAVGRQQRARIALRQPLAQRAARDMTSAHLLVGQQVMFQAGAGARARPREALAAHQSEERARRAQMFQGQTRQQIQVRVAAVRQVLQQLQGQGLAALSIFG